MLSASEEDRIAAAVTEAEAATSGDILVVLAEEVSKYREVPLAWAAGVALAVPPIVLSFFLAPLAELANDLWLGGEAGGLVSGLGATLAIYAIGQIVLFLVALAVAHHPAVRRWLTPRALKRHRVAKAAHHQFASMGARASGPTGVLIFVALEDRQVQILADAAIHQQCGETPWTKAANAVAEAMKGGHDPTAGIIEAVRVCGAALAEHFPAVAGQQHGNSPRPLEV